MAAFNPNVARASVIQELFGQLVINTLYFANTGNGSFSWNEANLNDLAFEVTQFWQNQMLGSQSSDLTLQGCDTYSLASSEAPAGNYRLPSPAQGGDVTGALPGSVALSVSFRTGGRGRTTRGRNYFGGIAETRVADNLVAQLTVDAIVAAYTTMITTTFVPQTSWCVYSQFFEGQERLQGTFRFVTEVVVVDNVVDSQRRRLPGRGSV